MANRCRCSKKGGLWIRSLDYGNQSWSLDSGVSRKKGVGSLVDLTREYISCWLHGDWEVLCICWSIRDLLSARRVFLEMRNLHGELILDFGSGLSIIAVNRYHIPLSNLFYLYTINTKLNFFELVHICVLLPAAPIRRSRLLSFFRVFTSAPVTKSLLFLVGLWNIMIGQE